MSSVVTFPLLPVVGADILDKTGQNAFSFGRLREEPTWWELDSNQRIHFDEVQRLNQYLREEYHQLQDVLWHSGYSKLYSGQKGLSVFFHNKPGELHSDVRVNNNYTTVLCYIKTLLSMFSVYPTLTTRSL